MNEQGQWQVSGTAADIYEKALVPAIFTQWAPIVMDLVDPHAGERIVDIACGTGIVARTVAERVGPTGAVAGVDLNPGMLNVARAIGSTVPYSSAPLAWHEASADKLPFRDASFDVAFCQLGLQFFSDRAAALREMQRVLVPGGKLAVMVWCSIHQSPGFAFLADALERHVGPAAATIMRAPFGLYDVNELITLVRHAGFQVVVVRQQVGTVRFPSVERLVLDYVAGSPLAGPVSQASDAARVALMAEARNALAQYVRQDALTFPIEAHLLSARA